MDPEVTKHLDQRAKWNELQKFEPHEQSRVIVIPDDDLKTLCLQPCSVLISKFNVLERISDAYKKDCEKFDNDLNEENLELMFRTKGMKIYKKFYEPRLEWFAQQREFVRYVRQQEIYYKTIIQLVNRRKVDRILSDNPPLDSQIFTAEISVVPQSTQKSEISDEDFRAIVSQLEEIC